MSSANDEFRAASSRFPIPSVRKNRLDYRWKCNSAPNTRFCCHTGDIRDVLAREPTIPAACRTDSTGIVVFLMRTVWRFFVDASGLWYWEELRADKSLVRRSASSFEHYDDCVNDAKRAGYKFEASQEGSPRSTSIRKRT